MALVNITVLDGSDGKVSISMTVEPPMSQDEDLTDAQATALLMLDAVATPEDITSVDGD